jgi:hypothetical protein
MTQPAPELTDEDREWMLRPFTGEELEVVTQIKPLMPPLVAAGFVLRWRANDLAQKRQWDGVEITTLQDVIYRQGGMK